MTAAWPIASEKAAAALMRKRCTSVDNWTALAVPRAAYRTSGAGKAFIAIGLRLGAAPGGD